MRRIRMFSGKILTALLLVVLASLPAWAASVSTMSVGGETSAKIGDPIDIVVVFDAAVDVTSASSKLRLNMGRGTANPYAVPTANAASVTQATFRYTVVAGDQSTDLDYTDTLALTGVTNFSGPLPAPGGLSLLASANALVVDGVIPVVSALPAPASITTLSGGTTYSVPCTFSEPVTGLQIGDVTVTNGECVTVSGSGATYTLAIKPRELRIATAAVIGTASISISNQSASTIAFVVGDVVRIGSTIYRIGTATSLAPSASGSLALATPLVANVAVGDAVWRSASFATTVVVNASAVSDVAGNASTASSIVTTDIDLVAPQTIVMAPTALSATTLDFTVLYSEDAATSLTAAGMTITGGTLAIISQTNQKEFVVKVIPTTGAATVNLAINAGAVTDAAGNPSTGYPVVSYVVPVVISVVANPATGAAKATDSVAIIMTLNRSVTLGGTQTPAPTVTLETEAVDRTGSLTTVAGATTQLAFTYVVQTGDVSADLDVVSANAIDLKSATIDGFTSLAMPAPAATGSLGAISALRVDGIAPTIVSVTAPTVVTSGTSYDLMVTASEAVDQASLIHTDVTATNASVTAGSIISQASGFTVPIMPKGPLTISTAAAAGATTVRMTVGTVPLSLPVQQILRIGSTSYRVAAAVTVGMAETDVILQSGLLTAMPQNSTVFLPAGVACTAEIQADGFTDTAGNSNVAASVAKTTLYDPTPPEALIGTSTRSNTAPFAIQFPVIFSESLQTTLLPSGVTTTGASSVSVSGSAPDYTVSVVPTAPTSTVTLSINANAVTDFAGNTSVASTTASFIPTAVATNPGITSSPATGTLGVGALVTITIPLTRTAVLAGTGPAPTLQLETGATDRYATLTTTTGTTSVLVFTYTVVAGDASADLDVTSASALDLKGWTVDGLPSLTVPAPSTAGSLGLSSSVIINTGTAIPDPTITITRPGNRVNMSPIVYQVEASEPITDLMDEEYQVQINGVDGGGRTQTGSGARYQLSVTPRGTLKLAADASATATTLSLVSDSGDQVIASGSALRIGTGVYRVDAGATVGASAATITLKSGLLTSFVTGETLLPGAGVTVAVALPAGAGKAGSRDTAAAVAGEVIYDPVPPLVILESPPASENPMRFTAQFSETVGNFDANDVRVVNGTVSSVIDVDGTDRKTWVISVIPTSVGSVSVTLPIGGVQDFSGLTTLASATYTNLAEVVQVSANNANGAYETGTRLELTVRFGRVVTVTGKPTLTLALGGGRAAEYSDGTGTDTLEFSYTIQDGDTSADLDYTTTTALQLAGGTIKDPDNGNAVLTLPTPGATGSLGASKNLVINPMDDGPVKPAPGPGSDDSGSSNCGTGSGVAMLLALAAMAMSMRWVRRLR